MADKPVITPELLRQLLDYNPETGAIFWRERAETFFTRRRTAIAWNKRYAGTRALNHAKPTGYLSGCLFNRHVLAHRVAWALAHGEMPNVIDHINGDRKDNRLTNLRNISYAENSKNSALPKTNKSGRIGVCAVSGGKYWLSQISSGKQKYYLGRFDNIEDAIKARVDAELKFGFHSNHGR